MQEAAEDVRSGRQDEPPSGDSGDAGARRESRFSRALTWLLTGGLVAVVGALAWDGPDRHAQLSYPGYVVVRTYDSQLDVLAAATARWPRIAPLVFGTDVELRDEAILAFQGVTSFWKRTDEAGQDSSAQRDERDHLRAHLAILLLEGGRPTTASD